MPEVGDGSAASATATATALHLRSEKSDPSSGLCSSQSGGPSNPMEMPQGSIQQHQQHAAVTGTSCNHLAITSSLPAPSLGSSARRICPQDIQFVQNLIERCLQLYQSQREVVATLHKQAQIEPGFTLLIWQKLEEQNPDFFRGYYLRLKVKEQVVLFNHLLEQQVAMVGKLHMSWVQAMPPHVAMAHVTAHHHHHPGGHMAGMPPGMPPGMAPHPAMVAHHMVGQPPHLHPGMAPGHHHPFAPFPMMSPQMMQHHQRMAMMGGMPPGGMMPPPMAMFPGHLQHAAAAGFPPPAGMHMAMQQHDSVKAGQSHQPSHLQQQQQVDSAPRPAAAGSEAAAASAPKEETAASPLHVEMNGHPSPGLVPSHVGPSPPRLFGADPAQSYPGPTVGPASQAGQAQDELGFPLSLGASSALHDAHSTGNDVLMAMQDGGGGLLSDGNGHDALLALRCNSGELEAHLANAFGGTYNGDTSHHQGSGGDDGGRTRGDTDMGGSGLCGPLSGEGGPLDLPHMPRVFSFSDFGNLDLPPGQLGGGRSEGIGLTDFDLPHGQMGGKGEGLGMFDFDPAYLSDFDHTADGMNTMCPFDMALDFSSPPYKA